MNYLLILAVIIVLLLVILYYVYNQYKLVGQEDIYILSQPMPVNLMVHYSNPNNPENPPSISDFMNMLNNYNGSDKNIVLGLVNQILPGLHGGPAPNQPAPIQQAQLRTAVTHNNLPTGPATTMTYLPAHSVPTPGSVVKVIHNNLPTGPARLNSISTPAKKPAQKINNVSPVIQQSAINLEHALQNIRTSAFY